MVLGEFYVVCLYTYVVPTVVTRTVSENINFEKIGRVDASCVTDSEGKIIDNRAQATPEI